MNIILFRLMFNSYLYPECDKFMIFIIKLKTLYTKGNGKINRTRRYRWRGDIIAEKLLRLVTCCFIEVEHWSRTFLTPVVKSSKVMYRRFSCIFFFVKIISYFSCFWTNEEKKYVKIDIWAIIDVDTIVWYYRGDDIHFFIVFSKAISTNNVLSHFF